jgi:mannose-1-phosphate guanylyltransferase/mannose-6-phosphate isomerase
VLSGNSSLFQQAAERLQDLGADTDGGAPLVVGNEEHRFLVLDQLRELPARTRRRAAGTLWPQHRAGRHAGRAAGAAGRRRDPVLVVTPADQTVTDPAAFTAAHARRVRVAADGRHRDPGHRARPPRDRLRLHPGRRRRTEIAWRPFVEKPDGATERYLAEGGYFWNAGMFVLKASVWMAALAAFPPRHRLAATAPPGPARTDARFVRPGKAEFAAVPSESVDYAVMERCPGSRHPDIRMVPLDAGWNDLGAWDAVWQVAAKDAQGNASVGDASWRTAATPWCTPLSRLVAWWASTTWWWSRRPTPCWWPTARAARTSSHRRPAGREQRGEQTLHRKVHRPWGWYDSIDAGPRFQVKRIMVKPGAS